MTKFYLFLWLRWCLRIFACSVILATLASVLITAYVYINQNLPALNKEVVEALFEVFKFWFPITWSLTLLLALFRSLKYIFNSCLNGYKLELLTCKEDEVIEVIGYGDLLKVWRRWFMLIIWLVGTQMVVALMFTNVFTSFNSVFDWFDIYFLFAFVLVSGYLSFILLAGRCKRVKVSSC